MILTLLVLPTVIIAAREAIRSVPDSIRQGAYALGATQWQVVSRQVLPAAIPGIATGSILALARAIGETAPLILIGAVTYISFDPTILGPFTALPIQIYSFLRRAPGGVQAARGRLDHRPARDPADAERVRDLHPQPLPEDLVTTTMPQLETHARSSSRANASSSCTTWPSRTAQRRDPTASISTSYEKAVTAFIGPSGCGKSTLIRCLDRMNDLLPKREGRGQVLYHGKDLYAADVDPVEVRRRIGMVFQKPNPFPKSIYDNVAFGPRVLGLKGDLDERVERALQHAALWDEVKDRLKESALGLSGGQQQRPLHRPLPRGRAGRDPDGRARVGARPDLDHADRGPDARAQARVHDRDRDAQHAAGRSGRGHDGVLLGRGRGGDGKADGRPRRVRPDGEDLHDAGRPADGGLRHREVRMRISFQEQLDELEASLRHEGDLVLRSLRAAVEAVCTQDTELADEVIAFDDDSRRAVLRGRAADRAAASPARHPWRATSGSCSRC
jgi:hypothetical protein